MQRQGTLQFWDDYHSNHSEQEWISKPYDVVLEMIFDRFQQQQEQSRHHGGHDVDATATINILEIGCGTSELVKNVKDFFDAQFQNILEGPDRYREIYACGTDVSPICIEHLKKRDRDVLAKYDGLLQYQVLNVVDGKPPLSSQKQFDLILDKGCLDTFLFRTRQRGPSADYNELIRQVLDNLHSWMKQHDFSQYMLLSPRAKLKAVRDYQGFSSVERLALPESARSTLEGTKTSDDHQHSPTGYLYVCNRNNDYTPGTSEPFVKQRSGISGIPNDDTKCLNCGTTFLLLRKGESVDGRGATFWTRHWNGHCRHCKGKDTAVV